MRILKDLFLKNIKFIKSVLGDKDHNDSCQSQVCNCDMQFSSRLKLLVSTWQPNFHKSNGFSRKKQCLGVTDKLGAKTNQERNG